MFLEIGKIKHQLSFLVLKVQSSGIKYSTKSFSSQETNFFYINLAVDWLRLVSAEITRRARKKNYMGPFNEKPPKKDSMKNNRHNYFALKKIANDN